MNKLPIQLSISEQDTEQLKSLNKKVIDHLEEGFSLKISVLDGLKNLLSEVVAKQPGLKEAFKTIEKTGEDTQVQFMHSDNEILNLPWSYAVDPVSNKTLGTIPELTISKCLPDLYRPTQEEILGLSPPLKVLLMISSPEDSDLKSRLSYEDEELEILRAFEPLMKTGQVQLDFTNDGSLEELRRKVTENTYHILHFSGHGVFKNNKGYLVLEEPNNLNTQIVEAAEFAEALNSNPKHKIPIVVLASCQTAQGNNEKGLQGVTNHLLKIGIPVVISMGLSILDEYASYFTAQVYENIVKKLPVSKAFQKAVDAMRVFEYESRQKKGELNPVPLQWIIPNLYTSTDFEYPVVWKEKEERLDFTSSRFVFENNRLILKHDKNYLFIGRRKDKARIMHHLLEKSTIFIKGQGGVGKTSLAEHLVQRLIASDPLVHPFVFNEKASSPKDIQEPLKRFLEERNKLNLSELNLREKSIDQFRYLVNCLTTVCHPVFIFDNLESFQENPEKGFNPDYQDLKETIDLLADSRRFYVILTGRYTIPGFEYTQELNLNQVGLNDFWKKCQNLELGKMAQTIARKKRADRLLVEQENRPLSFADIVELLHKSLGGNYRALEFFNNLVGQDQEKFETSLSSLEDFQKAYQSETEEVRAKMSQNLLFSELLILLSIEEKKLLSLLGFFRIPVQEFALELQLDGNSTKERLTEYLLRLFDMTLIELSLDVEIGKSYCYVTTIIKELLGQHGQTIDITPFSHNLAGKYYYYNSSNLTNSLSELEEAFYHYHLAKNNTRVEVLGNRLSNLYYNVSLYHSALHYAFNSYQQLGVNTSFNLLNRLGMIMHLFGDYDYSIEFYEKALHQCQEAGDKSDEGSTLNNISGIYQARGDYDTALEYIERSLSISQKIGDKSGEGVTLNNISQIYGSRGDYDTALEYLERSLSISQKIGDKFGEGATLNNIGLIYDARSDYARALEYYEHSLRIRQEIGDKSGEGATLNNISAIFSARGDYARALEYYERSLHIRMEIGDKSGEGVSLSNIGTIFSYREDYAKALDYYERSLHISQDIGDKAGEGTTLNNISTIYDAQGDYDTALEYLECSLSISQEIGDKFGEGKVLNNISQIYVARRDYDTALEYLERSLSISQEIGDKSGEGATLFNISQIYDARGDYDTALEYLESSLRISQEIGDKSGEGATLYNISQIFQARRDYDTALKYLESSLRISQETGDKSVMITTLYNMSSIAFDSQDTGKGIEYCTAAYQIAHETNDAMGLFHAGGMYGQILHMNGKKEQGMAVLKRSYQIGQKAGFPNLEELASLIHELENQ